MAGCVDNTDSIALTTTGGSLTADAIIDPASGEPPNALEINAGGLYVQGANGWLPLSATLAYSSADSPTFIATTSADLTSFIGPGDKIWLTQAGSLYFIVTAITATTITLYGGTGYTLTNAAITLPYFSKERSPIGFPLAPSSWTQQLVDTNINTKATPVSGTWYNPGSLSLVIPIGVWNVSYQVTHGGDGVGGTGDQSLILLTTLSTANNSSSDADWQARAQIGASVAVSGDFLLDATEFRFKEIALAAKATYFLNAQTLTSSVSEIYFRGNNSGGSTIIRAVSAYL